MKLRQILLLLVFSISQLYILAQSNNEILGMINLENKYMVDETVVTVESWLSYYNWVYSCHGLEEANNVLPDSSVMSPYLWEYIKSAKLVNTNRTRLIIGEGFSVHTYQAIPKTLKKCQDLINQDSFLKRNLKGKRCPFGSYPIIGLTYAQVVEFCRWRTQHVGGDSIIYRLPTEEEWKEIANFSLNHDEKMKGMRDSTCSNLCLNFNYRQIKGTPHYEFWGEDGMSLKTVALLDGGKSGIYDIFGNVSQMIMEEGASKGGNYTLFASQCHIDSIQKYDRTVNWLGFRCIVGISR